MGCSNSHPAGEGPQPQMTQRDLPAQKASGLSISMTTPHSACAATTPGPEPNHSLPTEQESEPMPAIELQSAQTAPEAEMHHDIEVNNADSATTLPAPVSSTRDTTATMELSTEDMSANTTDTIQNASTGPAPGHNKHYPPEKICTYCSEMINLEKEDMLYPCVRCDSGCCKSCIRKMFLNACKSESDMPPRCCKPIPLAFARAVLSDVEVCLFKAKYEEWNTPNRIYCPVPTCSAFIPHRLFPVSAQNSEGPKENQAVDKQHYSIAMVGTSVKVEIDTPPPTPPGSSSPHPSSQAPPSISCPKCETNICCSCKQLAHDGFPCPEVRDTDPLLERALRKWGYKRCPKCHAGVRRMWGCSHIRCRCGAQWCWECTGPIERCNQEGCLDQDRDGEEDDSRASDTDTGIGENFDAGSDWEDYGYDLGEEPNGEYIDPLTCQHSWEAATDDDTDPNLEYDCECCWKKVFPQPFPTYYRGVQPLMETGSLHEQQDSGDECWVGEDQAMQRCHNCGLIACSRCRDGMPMKEQQA